MLFCSFHTLKAFEKVFFMETRTINQVIFRFENVCLLSEREITLFCDIYSYV